MCLASITIHCKPVHVVALYVAKLKHIHVLSKETKNAVQYNCGSGPEAAPARRAAHVSRCWSQAALLSSTTSRKNTQILIHLNLNSTNYFQSQNHNWDYTGTLTTQAVSMAHCSLQQLCNSPNRHTFLPQYAIPYMSFAKFLPFSLFLRKKDTST